MVQHAFHLVVAGVVPEPVVEQVSLVDLDWRPLVAEHKLLEGEEAKVPGVSLFVSHEGGERGRLVHHGADLELPYLTIGVGEALEWPPVLEMLRLVSREGHLADVCDHVSVVDGVVAELALVGRVEHVVQLRTLPHGVSPQQEVVFVLTPLDIAHAEVVVLGHLQWPLAPLNRLGWGSFNLLSELANDCIVYAHII